MSKRDEWTARMKAQLDEWNSDLESLEGKVAELSEPVRAKLDPQLAKLRDGYGGAKVKLNEVRSAGEEKWDEATGEVEHVWKTLKASIKYFKSQL